MNIDEYGEVTNGEDTFRGIAAALIAGRSILVGWTDQEGTHFDILFTIRPVGFGTWRGGIRPSDLFVSIMRIGSFGFEIQQKSTDAGYYEEKLSGRMNLGSTAEKLAELINGVKNYL